MSGITKVGIIQNAPLTGDFSNNLRAIVQGYRACLDSGAELCVAPISALCGLNPGDFINRPSFLTQAQDALIALSHEIGEVPLIVGAYSDFDPDEVVDKAITMPMIYLVEQDCVTELDDWEVQYIAGASIVVSTGTPEEICADELNGPVDYLIYLSDTPWNPESTERHERAARETAQDYGTTVICCSAVGTTTENLYAGRSTAHDETGRLLLRMPAFETAEGICDLDRPVPPLNLPEPDARLAAALERGVRDFVRANGHTGVCIPMDMPQSLLLTTLCVAALGSSNVVGVTFEDNTRAAKPLGIDIRKLSAEEPLRAVKGLEASPALEARLRATLLCTYADQHGLMPISALTRSEIIPGNFTLYGESCGLFAPLGSLYEIDVYLLSAYYSQRYDNVFGTLTEPDSPVRDRIIHELADLNHSAGYILHNKTDLPENDVRLMQRRMIASAIYRAQLPPILHIEPKEHRHHFPITHRLND